MADETMTLLDRAHPIFCVLRLTLRNQENL